MSRFAADAWLSRPEMVSIYNRVETRKNALNSIRWPQVLRTHTNAKIPADGVGVVPDNLNAVTSDNADGWDKLNITLGGSWDCAMEINNYGDSKGQGCEYVAYVRESGVLYRKCWKLEGAQTWRLHDWVAIPEEPPVDSVVVRALSAITSAAKKTWAVLNTPIGDLFK